MSETIVVTITGAAGQVAARVITSIASGEVYGQNKNIILKLLETPAILNNLKPILMELEDCCYSGLKKIIITDNPYEAFENSNRSILIGAKPRKTGMKRSDLIKDNVLIFKEQGHILNEVAADDIRILVVGNPANTNCYVAMNNAPDIPKERFSALTSLDQNRAYSLLASKAKVSPDDIKKVVVWGNHGEFIYPDVENAIINGINAIHYINDNEWIFNNYVTMVRNRGSEIIDIKGSSTSLSASKAVIDHIKNFESNTPFNNWFCAAVPSDGSYGIDKDLIFSFPLTNRGQIEYKIVNDIGLSNRTIYNIKESINAIKKEIEIANSVISKKTYTKVQMPDSETAVESER